MELYMDLSVELMDSNLIENALKKNKIVYSGSPESVRDYIHVIDAARASLKALDKKFNNKTIIISGQKA